MSISVLCQKGGKRDRPWSCIVAKIIAVGMMASTCGYAQTPRELLSQANGIADQGNWFRAALLYAKAEKKLQETCDPRNELYVKFCRLRGETESGACRSVRVIVVRDMAGPTVQVDPQL